jgi:hypothetical protein
LMEGWKRQLDVEIGWKCLGHRWPEMKDRTKKLRESRLKLVTNLLANSHSCFESSRSHFEPST